MQPDSSHRRLIIVANRLPFKVTDHDGSLSLEETTGGLVTGLRSFLTEEGLRNSGLTDYVWVGWPGSAIEEEHQNQLTLRSLEEFNAFPVFVPESDMENFYEGFCNKTIWPLFHYFTSFALYKEEYWSTYKQVNQVFCDRLLKILRPDDIVWIHDYHLMLLPKLLRAKGISNIIGYFHHIPFPSYELYRLLPSEWRKEILEGLLGADLVGFHTYDYTQHFLQCTLRILGCEHQLGRISYQNRVVTADAFPMGIEFKQFANALSDSAIRDEFETLKKMFTGVKVVLSVDRLDYTKGIVNRLEGFERLLETCPEYLGKIVLVAIVVPSRTSVEQYDLMKRQIEEKIGNINGRFGTVGWVPINYQYTYLSFSALTALYNVSDIALVTPLRDGMNLVAKEYVASQKERKGVLILSEMAGAAKELGEAIIINPNNREEIANALHEALEMPEDENIRRNAIMQYRLRRYDIHRWATEFISRLKSLSALRPITQLWAYTPASERRMLSEYIAGHRRLILLDYDGTLTPIVKRPDQAKPGLRMLKVLEALCEDPDNTVVIVSGRDRQTLQNWLGHLPLGMVAEHGIWIKEAYGEWTLYQDFPNAWKGNILPILEQYADRLPGSFVEEKEYSLSWHYRSGDPEQSQVLAREVTDHLVHYTANINLQILHGKKVIEVRNTGANKGTAATHWLSTIKPDFILAMGDDTTDEDLFEQLPETAYTFRVGLTTTRAKFNLRDSSEVLRVLEEMSEHALKSETV